MENKIQEVFKGILVQMLLPLLSIIIFSFGFIVILDIAVKLTNLTARLFKIPEKDIIGGTLTLILVIAYIFFSLELARILF